MNICKGLCIDFEVKTISGRTRYESGQKRCSKCAIFMISYDTRCPCCQTKFRLRSRLNPKKSLNGKRLVRY